MGRRKQGVGGQRLAEVLAGLFMLGIYLLRFIPPGPFLIRYKEYDKAAGDIRSAKDLYRKWVLFRSKRCLLKAGVCLERALPYFPDEEDVLLLKKRIDDAIVSHNLSGTEP